jgi:tRNA1(Val) A37 N6-methylase TrmN6
MNKTLRATEFSHFVLDRFILPGQTVIDATAGNGIDTLFLAERVTKTGKVYAFDIQKNALEKTKALLNEAGHLKQVSLIHDSHENIKDYVEGPLHSVIFNLGYLPGGDKSIITEKESSLQSLRYCVEVLVPGGVIAIVAYPGHAGGNQEACAIEAYLAKLPSPPWYVLSWKRVNGTGKAPYFLLAQKRI